jgi:hypothetical protein
MVVPWHAELTLHANGIYWVERTEKVGPIKG